MLGGPVFFKGLPPSSRFNGVLPFFRGGLDEVAIYPYVLSAPQVQEHYQIALGA
jgi:hypothetical protein